VTDPTGHAGDDGEERAVRVRRTGIALVHEGELILPADGSEAEARALRGETVHYHFPVEIEVCEPRAPLDADALVARVLAELARGLRSV
jgi:hypothetical protein